MDPFKIAEIFEHTCVVLLETSIECIVDTDTVYNDGALVDVLGSMVSHARLIWQIVELDIVNEQSYLRMLIIKAYLEFIGWILTLVRHRLARQISQSFSVNYNINSAL